MSDSEAPSEGDKETKGIVATLKAAVGFTMPLLNEAPQIIKSGIGQASYTLIIGTVVMFAAVKFIFPSEYIPRMFDLWVWLFRVCVWYGIFYVIVISTIRLIALYSKRD
jgi:hypothetical protein